jgi:hypothetical protein
MFAKLGGSLFFSLILSANGCDSKSAVDQTAAQPNAPQTASLSPSNPVNLKVEASPKSAASSPLGPKFLDACALIEKSEIASVQGAPVQSTLPSSSASGALAMWQCYYTVVSADGSKNLSVHLEVIQPDPKASSPNAVRDYWQRTFHQESKDENDEEKKEGGKPKPVPGLGEEAFWTGNDRVGAVYAIKKDKLVRVSVGGSDAAKIKIEKSTQLVAKVLKRLFS